MRHGFALVCVALMLWSCGGGNSDTVLPQVLSTSPADSSVGVAVDTTVSALLSENPLPSTVNSRSFTLGDGEGLRAGAVALQGAVLTFRPSSALDYDKTYTVTLTTAITDEAGNALERDYQWHFTTAKPPDTMPPVVVATSPVTDATDVQVTAPITAVFSESVDPATLDSGSFSLGSDVAGALTVSGSTVTFMPSAPLRARTQYTARVTTNVVDLAGNALRADYAWSFTTGAGLAPQVNGVALFAGSPGGPGNVDGRGANAAFSSPNSVAVDAANNVYVADMDNHLIRKITPDAVVTTLAGSTGGFIDGTGAAARFDHPAGVGVDAAGNVYVADSYNRVIRKVTPAGDVSTVATDTTLSFPTGVVVDTAGNVIVNDCGSQRLGFNLVRRISPAGSVTTVSTMGACTEMFVPGDHRWRTPSGIGIDRADKLYLASELHTVSGPTFSAGAGGIKGDADGSAGAARFNFPSGVAVGSDGTVYVADTDNNKIRSITPAGVVSTLAGTKASGAADGVGVDARFSAPQGVAVDASGTVYVADHGNSTIRRITRSGTVTTLAGFAAVRGAADGMAGDARFYAPQGAAIDSVGNLFVADSSNYTIRKIARDGYVTTFAGVAGSQGSVDGPAALARFVSPQDVAVDAGDNLYVADGSTIRKITPGGVVTTLAGNPGWMGPRDGTGSDAFFWAPSGVATDAAGNVYVADTANHLIRKVTPEGVVTTLAGTPGTSGMTDGTGPDARFISPTGIAVDGAGNLYVTEPWAATIRKITPGAVVTTWAGTALARGSADGTGSNARFNYPTGIAIDGTGNVYVADATNSTIRKITPDAVVTTVVGVAGRSGFQAGPLPGGLAFPQRIAIRDGRLYVTLRNGVAVVSPLP